MKKNPLFNEFAPVDKNTWLAKVDQDKKELAGMFNVAYDLNLSSYWHREDGQDLAPIDGANSWVLAQEFRFSTEEETNKQLLHALEMGCECIRVRFNNSSEIDFESLFNEVIIELIGLEVIFENCDAKILDDCKAFFNTKKTKDGIKIYSDSHDLSKDHKYQASDKDVIKQLADGLEWTFDQLQKARKGIRLSFDIHNNYFVEIAKLRALRILFANVLKALNVDAELIIDSSFGERTDLDNNTYRIAQTFMGMSAVIGGTDYLWVHSIEAKDEDQHFSERINRNIQHLFRMESHLDKVSDPMAGSYFMEGLTLSICEAAWKEFEAQISV